MVTIMVLVCAELTYSSDFNHYVWIGRTSLPEERASYWPVRLGHEYECYELGLT